MGKKLSKTKEVIPAPGMSQGDAEILDKRLTKIDKWWGTEWVRTIPSCIYPEMNDLQLEWHLATHEMENIKECSSAQ